MQLFDDFLKLKNNFFSFINNSFLVLNVSFWERGQVRLVTLRQLSFPLYLHNEISLAVPHSDVRLIFCKIEALFWLHGLMAVDANCDRLHFLVL